MSEASLQSKLIAEAIGVFALTFIGAGSIIMGGDLITVALAHGVVLSIVVSATMNVSGGHINPAVTISMMACLLYTSPSPRDLSTSRMPSSA